MHLHGMFCLFFHGWPLLVSSGIIKSVITNEQPILTKFGLLGGIKEFELLRTFNCGIGVALIVSPNDAANVLSSIQNERAYIIGHVEASNGGK